jgi:glutathione synthase/RimK-type ligase-like ATP-grasp enzyme
MRISLATCSELPEGDGDDALMAAALRERGHGVEWGLWDDDSIAWPGFDAVVVRSTWDYQRRRDEFLEWAAAVPRLFNPAEVLAWNTDKRYLAELDRDGIPVVATHIIPPGDGKSVASGVFTALGEGKTPDGEVVVKPSVSAGSKDTARFDLSQAGERERAERLLAEIHAGGRTAMVQPYLSSVDERGETALLYFGGELSHAIRKGPLLRPGEGPTEGFFAPETIEPRAATEAERALADSVVAAIAERFGKLLYARVDLILSEEGDPVVLEIELTEPSLFFAHADGAAERFASALESRLP